MTKSKSNADAPAGQAADGNFYNNWFGPDGKRLTGCRLVRVHTEASVLLLPTVKRLLTDPQLPCNLHDGRARLRLP